MPDFDQGKGKRKRKREEKGSLPRVSKPISTSNLW
jgi:hypothetical protein